MDAFSFDFYDPHADLLELAIWGMYTWFADRSDFLTDPSSEFGRLLAASQPPAAAPRPTDSIDSTDSSVPSARTAADHDSIVSTDSSVTPARTGSDHDSIVSTDSSVAPARTGSDHDSIVSTDSSVAPARTTTEPVSNVSTDSSVTPAQEKVEPAGGPGQAAPAVGLLGLISAAPLPPVVERYLNALQYFFSASQIYSLMHAEALRRARADLAERLTPASVGRLLSALGLPRDRTSQGRRFRLTLRALGQLLNTYPYVFRPDLAHTTLTRHIDLWSSP